MTSKDYISLTESISPNSPSYKNVPLAFAVGGLICTIGQGLINLYQYLGVSELVAPGLASITLIFIAALLTGLSLFDNIAKFAGAGTLVPITGFANAMVAPALEFKSEGLILGLSAKMFTIAGPVLVYGLSSATLYGLIIYLFKLY